MILCQMTLRWCHLGGQLVLALTLGCASVPEILPKSLSNGIVAQMVRPVSHSCATTIILLPGGQTIHSVAGAYT